MSARRPRLLDLCCGVGGASMGYTRAGWDVTGVDIAPQPDYPFTFVQADAVQFCRDHGHEWDAIHASWPCQAGNPLTVGTNGRRIAHPQLIPAGREAMEVTGRPWVIESTAGNPIRHDLRLVGDMFTTASGGFALRVWRPRYFELSGLTVPQPLMPRPRGRTRGWRHGTFHDGPYLAVYGSGGGKASVPEAREALGIDWTHNARSLAESIPPAYTELIGRHLIEAVSAGHGRGAW